MRRRRHQGQFSACIAVLAAITVATGGALLPPTATAQPYEPLPAALENALYPSIDKTLGVAFDFEITREDNVVSRSFGECGRLTASYDPRRAKGQRVFNVRASGKCASDLREIVRTVHAAQDRLDLAQANVLPTPYKPVGPVQVTAETDDSITYQVQHKPNDNFPGYDQIGLGRVTPAQRQEQAAIFENGRFFVTIDKSAPRILEVYVDQAGVRFSGGRVTRGGIRLEMQSLQGCCNIVRVEENDFTAQIMGFHARMRVVTTFSNFEIVRAPHDIILLQDLRDAPGASADTQTAAPPAAIDRSATAVAAYRAETQALKNRMDRITANYQPRLAVLKSGRSIPAANIQAWLTYLIDLANVMGEVTTGYATLTLPDGGDGFSMVARTNPDAIEERLALSEYAFDLFEEQTPASFKNTDIGKASTGLLYLLRLLNADISDNNSVKNEVSRASLALTNSWFLGDGALEEFREFDEGLKAFRILIRNFAEGQLLDSLDDADLQTLIESLDRFTQSRAWTVMSQANRDAFSASADNQFLQTLNRQWLRELQSTGRVSRATQNELGAAQRRAAAEARQYINTISPMEALSRANADAIAIINYDTLAFNLSSRVSVFSANAHNGKRWFSEPLSGVSSGDNLLRGLITGDQTDLFSDSNIPPVSVDLENIANESGASWFAAVYSDDSARNENYAADVQNRLADIEPRLWEIFGAPLTIALRDARIPENGKVLLMSNGTLAVMPLLLARNPETGERLIDRYDFRFISALTDSAVKDVRTSRRKTIAGMFNTRNDLPYSDYERDASWNAVNNHAVLDLSDIAKNKPVFLNQLREADIWHFAVHGAFDWRNVDQSYLATGPSRSDRLTLADIRNASLSPELVILSACDTGVIDLTSDPDSLIGFPNGLIEAGAGAVIAPLWKVDDQATALLFAKFYELLESQDNSAGDYAAALRSAQLWLRDANNADLLAFVQNIYNKNPGGSPLAFSLLSTKFASGAPLETPFSDSYYWGGFKFFGNAGD